MKARRPQVPFLTDENVPDSVVRYLRGRGHSVHIARATMQGQPDQVVATAAIRFERVLVSWDKDFNDQSFNATRFAGLKRVAFSCAEVDGRARLKQEMALIELTYAATPRAARMTIRVGKRTTKIDR